MIYHPFSDGMIKAINDGCYLVFAAKLDLNSGVTRVHTGTGNLIIAGEVYQGVGQFGSVEAVKEALTTSPTQLLLSLSGFDSTLVGEVLNERSRGRDVRLMLVAIDDSSGQPILADVIFAGQIANLSVSTGDENAIGLTVSKQI
ncbi:Uncharacterised protein [Providencia stuartii]|nr:Uncharacterised protein [Providencia stuartii]